MTNDSEWKRSIPPGPYGLLDTVDKCWMLSNATNDGPRTYDDYGLARVAAQMIDVMLKQEPGRTRAMTYDPSPKRLKDTVKPEISAAAALEGLENGKYP